MRENLPSLPLYRWMGAAVSTVGRGHIERGLPCQDASSVSLSGEVVSLVISDGAGSARHSEQGAEIAVRTVTRVLRETAPWTAPEAVREQILTACRSAITTRAQELDCPISELAATLAFVAVTGDLCIAGNIGDGVVAAFRGEKSEVLIGPERGEFANETTFLTSSCANKHLRIIVKKPLDDYDGFAVMSDGAAESLYQRGKGVLALALIRILSRFEEHPSTVVTNDIRESVMPLLTSRTRDDCSLAVLRQAHVDLGDLGNKPEAFQMEILGAETRFGLRIRLIVLWFQRIVGGIHKFLSDLERRFFLIERSDTANRS